MNERLRHELEPVTERLLNVLIDKLEGSSVRFRAAKVRRLARAARRAKRTA